MSSDYDIEITTDDTLELDTIIKNDSNATDPISKVETSSSYNLNGFQTKTAVFDPEESGEYDIHINGQVLSINVTEASAIPDSGVSRWKFEQDVADSWGGNNGTDNTSAGFSTDSQVGTYSKNFDGTDDYVSIPYDQSLMPVGGDFSASFWTKTNGGDQYLIYFRNKSNSFRGWSFRTTGNNVVQFTLGDGNSNQFNSNSSISDGNWHHVVGTWDGTNKNRTIYIDGSEDASDNPSVGIIDSGSGQDLYFGRQQPQTKREYGGILDDVKYFNKELTSTEVSNLYNNDSIN